MAKQHRAAAETFAVSCSDVIGAEGLDQRRAQQAGNDRGGVRGEGDEGSTNDRQPSPPDEGNQCRRTAKMRINRVPRKKPGIA